MNLDILAICPHPDDAELHCAGLLLVAKMNGGRIGVLDLSAGEMGSRGNAVLRAQETEAANGILGLDYRVNLKLRDGFLNQEPTGLTAVAAAIRQTRPRLLVAPHWEDHHPDHVQASHWAREAAYLAGLARYPLAGAPHRPEQVLYYLDRVQATPSLVVDVSPVMAQKEAALRCYASQLHRAEGNEPSTPLSRPDFIERWRARHIHFGALIGVDFGEAYILRSPVPIANPLQLAWNRQGMV